MNPVARMAHAASAALVKNRQCLPPFANRLIDDVAKNPDGFLSRVVSVILGGTSMRNAPPPTSVPDSPIRVFIGPTNYAGQGYQWARALETGEAGVGARNLSVDLPGGFAFPADTIVPVAVYNHSTGWQRSELAGGEQFTHVLMEAERPLFGSLFGRDPGRELDELEGRGISCAFLCHGTDIRSPAAHAASNAWSPFVEQSEQTRLLQTDADANLALLKSRRLPVFVSTPDLLVDVPWATWCPVVVDQAPWAAGRSLWTHELPVVAHVPSMGSVKGSELIDPILSELHRAGVIEYRRLAGIPAAQMPSIIGDADIVLDQFRIGSYGVAAVEAMAAGRVVVGHVTEESRSAVFTATGSELPIVEANPSTLGEVLTELVGQRERSQERAAAGPAFVSRVHSGAMSSSVLLREWIHSAG